MGKSLIGEYISDTINDARAMYNSSRLAYSKKMSEDARMTGNSTWRNPNTAPYLYINSDGDVGPLAEFNDTHKGERYRFWDVDRQMNAYRQEYSNFENEAIRKGYTVYTKDGNELFKFTKNNRSRSQEATIGFDKELLEIRDKKGNIIECPHAPEESYNPAYRMYEQKRTMARIADDIVNGNTPNMNGSKAIHKYYKTGLEMMENGLDPRIEALNNYGLKFDSKFDRSKAAYQSVLEKEQLFSDRTSGGFNSKDIIDADYREITDKSDNDMIEMINDINKCSIRNNKYADKVHGIEDKSVMNNLPQTRQEFFAEALYWVASAIQNPQGTLSKFMDKYGDNIRDILDKNNENSKVMKEALNEQDASQMVKGINDELTESESGKKKDYEAINSYFIAQNEHIRNYNELFNSHEEILFRDDKGNTVDINIKTNDPSKRMAVINCMDAGKIKMFDRDGNEIGKISDTFTQNKDTFDKIAPDAERMAYEVTKRDLAELSNYSNKQKERYCFNGNDFDTVYENIKMVLPFRKEMVQAYDKGVEPLEVSMKQLQLGKYKQEFRGKAESHTEETIDNHIDSVVSERTTEEKCKDNARKINAVMAMAANMGNANNLNYEMGGNA